MVGSKSRREILRTIGLVLVFIGMQFGTAIRNVAPALEIVNIIMAVSIVLLMDYRGVKELRINVKLFAILCFQIWLLILALFSKNATNQLIVFHLYLIAFIITLNSNTRYCKFESFGRAIFWISGFISLVIVYQATQGFKGLQLSYEGTSKLWLSQGGDPITLARALGINIIACLFYKKKNRIEIIATGIFALADIIGLFSFRNRSVLLCSFVIFVIWYFKYYTKSISANKILISAISVMVVVIALYKIPYFSIKIKSTVDAMLSGIGTLLNLNVNGVDSSAQTRVSILENLRSTFNHHFIRNLFLGLGYNFTYVDRPVIQMFYDNGIFAFIAYAYLNLWVPIKYIFKTIFCRVNYNDAWLIVVFISLQNVFDQFLTGLPYFYFLWTPAIFMVFSITNSKKQLNG